MRRIDQSNEKIEHWKPENILSKSECLNYDNMLACCKGHIAGDSNEFDTCDAKKAGSEIYLDPRKPEHIKQILYRSKDGSIYSENEKIEKDLNVSLNLNSETHHLKQNRKQVLDTVISYLSNKNKGQWNLSLINKIKHSYETKDSNGNLKEYAGIVLWYLNKKKSNQN